MADKRAQPAAPERDAVAPREMPAIIGMRALAGGISALVSFFRELSPNRGFAFVVTDVNTDEQGTLPALLAGETPLPVHEVTEAMDIAADHVYLLPHGQALKLRRGRLQPITLAGNDGNDGRAGEPGSEPTPPHAPSPVQETVTAAEKVDPTATAEQARIAELEAEAALLRERLESTTARYEHATQELQKANRALQATNANYRAALERFASLFHANPIPVSLTRAADGLLVDINDAAVEFFGYSRDQIIGRKTHEIAQWMPQAERQVLLEPFRETGVMRDVELAIPSAGGEKRIALVTAVLIEMADTPMIISCFVDVTARVAAEREIHRLASELTLSEQAERRRLAGILHDDLQQRLFAIQMQLHMIQDDYPGEDEQWTERLQEVRGQIDEANLMARHLTVDLSPPVLEGEGLTEAVQWLVTQMDERAGLSVELRAGASYPIPNQDLRVLLFQCVRELLTNVLEHAHIDHAEVKLRGDAERLYIIVTDNGAGFDPGGPGATQDGLGLGGMKRRLGLFGGKLQVDSAPGTGTRVTIYVPLSAPYATGDERP